MSTLRAKQATLFLALANAASEPTGRAAYTALLGLRAAHQQNLLSIPDISNNDLQGVYQVLRRALSTAQGDRPTYNGRNTQLALWMIVAWASYAPSVTCSAVEVTAEQRAPWRDDRRPRNSRINARAVKTAWEARALTSTVAKDIVMLVGSLVQRLVRRKLWGNPFLPLCVQALMFLSIDGTSSTVTNLVAALGKGNRIQTKSETISGVNEAKRQVRQLLESYPDAIIGGAPAAVLSMFRALGYYTSLAMTTTEEMKVTLEQVITLWQRAQAGVGEPSIVHAQYIANYFSETISMSLAMQFAVHTLPALWLSVCASTLKAASSSSRVVADRMVLHLAVIGCLRGCLFWPLADGTSQEKAGKDFVATELETRATFHEAEENTSPQLVPALASTLEVALANKGRSDLAMEWINALSPHMEVLSTALVRTLCQDLLSLDDFFAEWRRHSTAQHSDAGGSQKDASKGKSPLRSSGGEETQQLAEACAIPLGHALARISHVVIQGRIPYAIRGMISQCGNRRHTSSLLWIIRAYVHSLMHSLTNRDDLLRDLVQKKESAGSGGARMDPRIRGSLLLILRAAYNVISDIVWDSEEILRETETEEGKSRELSEVSHQVSGQGEVGSSSEAEVGEQEASEEKENISDQETLLEYSPEHSAVILDIISHTVLFRTNSADFERCVGAHVRNVCKSSVAVCAFFNLFPIEYVYSNCAVEKRRDFNLARWKQATQQGLSEEGRAMAVVEGEDDNSFSSRTTFLLLQIPLLLESVTRDFLEQIVVPLASLCLSFPGDSVALASHAVFGQCFLHLSNRLATSGSGEDEETGCVSKYVDPYLDTVFSFRPTATLARSLQVTLAPLLSAADSPSNAAISPVLESLVVRLQSKLSQCWVEDPGAWEGYLAVLFNLTNEVSLPILHCTVFPAIETFLESIAASSQRITALELLKHALSARHDYTRKHLFMTWYYAILKRYKLNVAELKAKL